MEHNFPARYSGTNLFSRWKARVEQLFFFRNCVLFILLYGIPIILTQNESIRCSEPFQIYNTRKRPKWAVKEVKLFFWIRKMWQKFRSSFLTRLVLRFLWSSEKSPSQILFLYFCTIHFTVSNKKEIRSLTHCVAEIYQKQN